MKVWMTTQFWTAVSPRKKKCNQSSVRKLRFAVASMKKGKSVGVDNIPADLVQAGGKIMIDVLTEFCNKIWRTGEWPTP